MMSKRSQNGREGGLMIEGYNDIKTDDTIEAYIMEEIKKISKLTRKRGGPSDFLVFKHRAERSSYGKSFSDRPSRDGNQA